MSDSTPVRSFQIISLEDIYERNEDTDEFMYFNYKERKGNFRYRIPEHQRYPTWKPEKINKLIDSVMNNFSISGFIVSKHIENNDEYYNIEDGQSRLSILQSFYNDDITWRIDENIDEKVRDCKSFEVNKGCYFSDLKEKYQKRFKKYKISLEILNHFEDEQIHDLFERLQEGEPLKDKDLYWNRKDTTLVSYAIELTKKPFWINAYMGTSKPIDDKYRIRLPDVCALVSGIINSKINSKDEIKDYEKNLITPSFRKQRCFLDMPIPKQKEKDIESFLNYYNSIINNIYKEKESIKMRPFYNVAKDLGLILFEWLENYNQHSDKYFKEMRDKWTKVIKHDIHTENFMRGSKTLWNGLKSAEKQNTSDYALKKRLNKVNEWYANQK